MSRKNPESHAIDVTLRIPIRGYEISPSFWLYPYSTVTNPYKGL